MNNWWEQYDSRDRNPERIDKMLNQLAAFWLDHSDLRFCQLIMLITGSKDPFYIEDDKFIEMLEELLSSE